MRASLCFLGLPAEEHPWEVKNPPPKDIFRPTLCKPTHEEWAHLAVKLSLRGVGVVMKLFVDFEEVTISFHVSSDVQEVAPPKGW